MACKFDILICIAKLLFQKGSTYINLGKIHQTEMRGGCRGKKDILLGGNSYEQKRGVGKVNLFRT